MVTQEPVLAFYNPQEDLVIQCDASNKGIGAALVQNDRPIAYYSRAMTDTETCYADIEKEMLAVTVSFERFYQYIFGRYTKVISDHKPLEIIVKKTLSKAPSVSKVCSYGYKNITTTSSIDQEKPWSSRTLYQEHTYHTHHHLSTLVKSI